jgi:hypothetical protein
MLTIHSDAAATTSAHDSFFLLANEFLAVVLLYMR